MTTVTRYEQVERFDYAPSGKKVFTGAKVSRVGNQTYMRADGAAQIEGRMESEVFKAAALASMNGCAMKIGHGVNDPIVGKWINPRQAGSHVEMDGIPSDAHRDAVELAPAGLSAEYSAELISFDPSNPEHAAYAAKHGRCDFFQTGIRVSAVSLVDVPRCGPSCTLKSDCDCAAVKTNTKPTERKAMSTNTIRIADGLEVPANEPELIQAAVNELTAASTKRLDAMRVELDAAVKLSGEAKARIDAAEKKSVELQALADSHADANPVMITCDCADVATCIDCGGKGIVPLGDEKTRADRALKRAAKRTDAQREVFSVLLEADRIIANTHERSRLVELAMKGDALELKRRVIQAIQPRVRLDGKDATPIYIAARYDVELERFKSAKESQLRAVGQPWLLAGGVLPEWQRQYLGDGRADHGPSDDPETARQNMIARERAAFMRPATAPHRADHAPSDPTEARNAMIARELAANTSTRNGGGR